ncbi:TetR/AcrR family transcriptional regulator [Pontivivens ytuae]|uniref:TetR/AcrR family transcriptional regulator n=1 Tax=Pontivivens ytuae TaxID=2789856 RepID=A0A7S9LQD9_9RHOB|nr:TetR/AcrR family transcriptional regulator [Pontivivens ytuae]QPH53387.1 TetR/AcrR family transcriptional regulator [Pontivivens ytuae]
MSDRIPNDVRTSRMRAALMDAARNLFLEQGFAKTSTPQIVKAAGVTRGALYHHFADKTALFLGVLEREAENVALRIDGAIRPDTTPLDALRDGAGAYISAMSVRGRTRLMLIEAPAVLGAEPAARIDEDHARAALREGLEAARKAGQIGDLPLDALTAVLSAAFDGAALAVADGVPQKDATTAIVAVIDGLRS